MITQGRYFFIGLVKTFILMVLEKLTGSSDEDQDIEEIDEQIEDLERDLMEIEGQKRTEQLKKQRRQELKQKQRELKKEKLKQTRAGKVLNAIGQGLENIADNTSDQQTSSALDNLAAGIERVDGDGQGDTRQAMGIGLDNGRADIELEGDVTIQGDVVEEGELRQRRRRRSRRSRTGELSSAMEDIIK